MSSLALSISLFLFFAMSILYVVRHSYNLLTMQVLYNQTRKAYPGSRYWRATLPVRESLHKVLRKRNEERIKLIVSILCILLSSFLIANH